MQAAVALLRLCSVIYAISGTGERVRASPKAEATCPECNDDVVPKCGRIMVWHWAHTSNNSCDNWGEEGKWHSEWKLLLPPERTEYIIERGGEKHRADYYSPKGITVEFQHSSIKPEEIEKRESFYGPNMIWVFDLQGQTEQECTFFLVRGGDITLPRFEIKERDGDYVTFRWRRPRASIKHVRANIYFDLGDNDMLRVGKIYMEEPPCGGYGWLLSKEKFLSFINPPLPPPPLPPPQGSLF